MQQAVALACFTGAATIAAFYFKRSTRYQLARLYGLKEKGVMAQGTVIAAYTGAALRLVYEFAPAGGVNKRYVYVSPTKGLKDFSAGDSVDIVYAPDVPAIHAVKELYDDKVATLETRNDRLANLPWQTAIVFSITLWRAWLVYSANG